MLELFSENAPSPVTAFGWSLDAPSFTDGSQSPGSGLFILAIEPKLLDADFEQRMADQLERLRGHGVHVPGRAGAEASQRAALQGLTVSKDVVQRISEFAARYPA